MSQYDPKSRKDMILRHLCETRGMTADEALAHYTDRSGRQRVALQEQAERRMVEMRRAAVGRPVYRPRNDYVGGP